jgi:hypothetical protein
MYSSRGCAPWERLARSFRSLSRSRLVSSEIIVFRCLSSYGVISSLSMML